MPLMRVNKPLECVKAAEASKVENRSRGGRGCVDVLQRLVLF